MKWKAFKDYGPPKAPDDELSLCSICCTPDLAGNSWGTYDEDHEKGGWLICDACHNLYLGDPLAAWQKAQDRWEKDGPCLKLKESVLHGR